MDYQAPDRVNQEKNDAYTVWETMAFCEWVSKATRCPDVLLKQVATNSQTYEDTSKTISYSVSKKSRGNHHKKDKCCRHLQPVCKAKDDKCSRKIIFCLFLW